MTTLCHVLLILLGIGGGALSGAAAALLATWLFFAALAPWDPAIRQAGWVYALLTVPVGAIVGAVLGGLGGHWFARLL